MEFYDVMNNYLSHNRCCNICGDNLWMGYCDGHISDQCLNCEEYFNFNFGYITAYPIPMTSLPENIETCNFNYNNHLEHEKYYRKKKNYCKFCNNKLTYDKLSEKYGDYCSNLSCEYLR